MNTGNLVRRALDRSVKARNSNQQLVFDVFQTAGMNFTPEQKEIFFSHKVESIVRARRDLKKLYPATPEVEAERQFKAHTIQQNIKSTKPEKIVELIDRPLPRATSWLKDEDTNS